MENEIDPKFMNQCKEVLAFFNKTVCLMNWSHTTKGQLSQFQGHVIDFTKAMVTTWGETNM